MANSHHGYINKVDHGNVPKYGKDDQGKYIGALYLISKVLTKDSSTFGQRDFTPPEYGVLYDKRVISDENRYGDNYNRFFQFKPECEVYIIRSPVDLHIKNSITQQHMGPSQDDRVAGLIDLIPGGSYFVVENEKIAVVPSGGMYELTFKGTGTGTFDFELQQVSNERVARQIKLVNLPVNPLTIGTMLRNTASPNSRIQLGLDINGDGIIDRVYSPLFSDDLEGSTNAWQKKSHWHLTSKNSCAGPNTAFPSPPTAWYFGVESTCNIKTGGGELISPAIVLTPGDSKLTVSFSYFLNLGNQPGKAVVFALFNRGGKQQIWSGATATLNKWDSTGNLEVSVPKKATAMRLQFVVYTLPKGSPPATGWFIDDVSVQRVCIGSTCGSLIQQAENITTAGAVVTENSIEFHAQGTNVQSTKVEIFSLTGERLFNSGAVAGNTVLWQTKDSQGHTLANGVYLYVLTTTSTRDGEIIKTEVHKLIVKR